MAKRPPLPRKSFPAYLHVRARGDVRVALRRPFTALREFDLTRFSNTNVWSQQSRTTLEALAPGLYAARVGYSDNTPVVLTTPKATTAQAEIARLTAAMGKRKGRFRTNAPGVRGEKQREANVQRLQDRNHEMTEFLVGWLHRELRPTPPNGKPASEATTSATTGGFRLGMLGAVSPLPRRILGRTLSKQRKGATP